MSSKKRKYWKALKCPICSDRAVFYVTMDAVDGAEQYPVPFTVIHDDHAFTIYLDSGLLISRIEEPEAAGKRSKVAKTRAKKRAKRKKAK